jgi:GntR family transcriptional regulator, phosphonate transport system regulatory protein
MTPHRSAIWRAIAETLSAEIAAGHYRPGQKLPTETQLALRFDVNRHTVRHALAALASQGLVHPRRGSGVFVATQAMDYPLDRRVRFHRNIMATGKTPSRRISRMETRHADATEAEALHLAPGAMVHVVEGTSLADDMPMAVFRSVFPADRLPGLLAALSHKGSITVALAAQGVADYTRAVTRLTAQNAPATLALQLMIAEGAPVLQTIGINVDASGQAIEFGTTWFAGDRVTLTVKPD